MISSGILKVQLQLYLKKIVIALFIIGTRAIVFINIDTITAFNKVAKAIFKKVIFFLYRKSPFIRPVIIASMNTLFSI